MVATIEGFHFVSSLVDGMAGHYVIHNGILIISTVLVELYEKILK